MQTAVPVPRKATPPRQGATVLDIALPSDFPPRLDNKIVLRIERTVLVDYPTSRT